MTTPRITRAGHTGGGEGQPRQTTFRLDVDIRAQLEDYARATRRNLNQSVNALLGDALHRWVQSGGGDKVDDRGRE